MYRVEFSCIAVKGEEGVFTDTADTIEAAREWVARIGPRNWGRYLVIDADRRVVERGDRNPLGVVYPEQRCTECGAVKLPSGEHLCP